MLTFIRRLFRKGSYTCDACGCLRTGRPSVSHVEVDVPAVGPSTKGPLHRPQYSGVKRMELRLTCPMCVKKN